MKKILSILAIVAISLMMTACGGRNTTPADAEPEVDTTEVVVDTTDAVVDTTLVEVVE